MKIAVVYNRISNKVINLFGMPNREKYGLKSIKRITDALKKGKHQVIALEGDKDLIDNLEDFMPQVLKGERPGMVFNLSYGIQGQARYTHVPGILEMVGIPYIGSGPLAHSLALDKVVAKMIFKQNGLPTPDFAVLDGPGFVMPDLTFPLIVKPKNEAVSFGIRIVNTEDELRDAAGVIFDKFQQPVLTEQYIAGREINVGILGNSPPEAFAPAELTFGKGGPDIYTYEDKTRQSGREVGVICPAKLDEKLASHAQDVAIKAFIALGCYDCARVDMRMDKDGNFYLLEINSLPSMGEHGSYVAAAEAMGMDFAALVNRLVEVAGARYFGTPSPPDIAEKSKNPSTQVFNYISKHRDKLEKRLSKWCSHSSRTADMVGRMHVINSIKKLFDQLFLKPVDELTNDKVVWTWESKAGLKNGILLLCQIDIPFDLRNLPSNRYVQLESFANCPWEFFFTEMKVWTAATPVT
jgi:D-alanine-D-alanine ligase